MDLLKKINSINDKRKTQGILNSYLEQITKLIDEGHTKKQIFEILKTEKIINCKYEYFIKTIKKMIEDKKESLKSISKQPPKNETGKSPAPSFVKKSFRLLDIDDSEFK